MSEWFVPFTDWVNNKYVASLFPGEFYLNTYIIWFMYVSNLSEVTLHVCILYYMGIYIIFNYLYHIEDKEWAASANISMVIYKGVSMILTHAPLSQYQLLMTPVVKRVHN